MGNLSHMTLGSDDASFVAITPALFLVRLFENWPELFFDGKVFKIPYAELTSNDSREVVKAKIASLLVDCAILAGQETPHSSANELQRVRLSCDMLQDMLVDT